MTSTPNKRKNISLEEKYEIIKDKEKGMSVKDLVDKYKYGASTICTITKSKHGIMHNQCYLIIILGSTAVYTNKS